MTFRPASQSLSRREAIKYNKAVRALAHKGRMTAHDAVGKLNGYRAVRDKSWHRLHSEGSFYITHVQVDDDCALDLDDGDVYDYKVDFTNEERTRRQTDMTVSLMDIAKPSRRKVRAKKNVLRVQELDWDLEDFIELDEADAFSVFSEDWEDLCSEGGDEGHERTYASVTGGGLAEDGPT